MTNDAHALERWTDRGRHVVMLASQIARKRGDEYVGTEHLLLGILQEGGIAAAVLRQIVGDLSRLQAVVDKLLICQPSRGPSGPLPLTPRARRALDNAHEEAIHLAHEYVGTEHLLLSLLADRDGVVVAVFECLHMDRESVRAQILKILGLDPPS